MIKLGSQLLQRSEEHRSAVRQLTPLFEASQRARPVFLLGAGASYRSGVPLADDAVKRIAELIAPALEPMGFELVRVRFSSGQRAVLQVMAERPDGTMNVDDCAEVSRVVSAILDVEDPISGAYTLEVSSPGIDRPLVRLADYERFAGNEARVETSELVDGRRRFRGRILGRDGEVIRLKVEGEEIGIPFATIASAKLVLTDELIAASLKQRH